MEFLDLSAHDRDDYEGKVVECNGRRYIVGDFLGVGAERIVHTLINEQSKLSLFVVKFLKRPRPRGIYTQTVAALRGADPDLARVMPFTIELDVPGGMVEFERNVESSLRGDSAAEHVRQGFDALQGASPSPLEARKHFEDALRTNPLHTEALYGLAHALWHADAPFEALATIEKAVEVEPNALHYRRTHISLARSTEQYRLALFLYRQSAQQFENVHDLDELGAEILLDIGNPEEAKQCLAGAILTDEQRKELRKTIDEAISARARALALMHEARANAVGRNWSAASSALLRGQEAYNRDPDLCMNTGFAMLHGGNLRLSTSLLLHASMVVSEPLAAVCTANAGFAMLKANDLERAMAILKTAALRLSSLHAGEIPGNEIDLPGVGVWIEGDSLMQERISVAADLVNRGLEQASTSRVDVPDPVRALAAAYRKAAAAAH